MFITVERRNELLSVGLVLQRRQGLSPNDR